ncbi:MAG: hypothetical protein R3B96_07610 [Pirellulaceae bacterium]
MSISNRHGTGISIMIQGHIADEDERRRAGYQRERLSAERS